MDRRESTCRISVGPKPLVKAPTPSVLRTVLTQSIVDLYFCPASGEKPSVCMRDLMTSIGYMHAQSWRGKKLLQTWVQTREIEKTTHGISSGRSKQHRLGRGNLISRHARPTHFPRHQGLVRPEIRAIADSLARERRGLSFVYPGNAVCASDLADGVKGTGVQGLDGGLCL